MYCIVLNEHVRSRSDCAQWSSLDSAYQWIITESVKCLPGFPCLLDCQMSKIQRDSPVALSDLCHIVEDLVGIVAKLDGMPIEHFLEDSLQAIKAFSARFGRHLALRCSTK